MSSSVPAARDPVQPARRRWWRRGAGPGRRRVWVQNVDVDVTLLQARLAASRARRTVMREQLRDSRTIRGARRRELVRLLGADDEVDHRACLLLEQARRAANRQDPIPNRIVNWWGGRVIEAAYQNLHAAEALMALQYDWDEIEAEIPSAVARVESELQRDDPRRVAAESLRGADPAKQSLTEARANLSTAIEAGHSAGDRAHSRLRSFRNAVLAAALLIALLMGAFCWYVAANHDLVPLCFTPPNAEGEPATWVCPTVESTWDSNTPTVHGPTDPQDVLLVAFLGVLGGALAAAVAIRGLTGTSTPYEVPLALAALKLPLGALTAVGGIIALQGDFIPGLSELDSQGQILAYSLVLGYAQQLLSGLLDRQGQSLLESAPGKSTDLLHPSAAASTFAPRARPGRSAPARRRTRRRPRPRRPL